MSELRPMTSAEFGQLPVRWEDSWSTYCIQIGEQPNQAARIALALKRGEEAMELVDDLMKYLPQMLASTPNKRGEPSFADRAAALLKEAT